MPVKEFGTVDQRPENIFERGYSVIRRPHVFVAGGQFRFAGLAPQAAQKKIDRHLVVVGNFSQQPA